MNFSLSLAEAYFSQHFYKKYEILNELPEHEQLQPFSGRSIPVLLAAFIHNRKKSIPVITGNLNKNKKNSHEMEIRIRPWSGRSGLSYKVRKPFFPVQKGAVSKQR
jgi:hypothetical protein